MNFLQKRIKIQTLQTKANEMNKIEDQMIDQGKDPVEARNEIQFAKTNFGRNCDIKQLPYKDDEKINGVGKSTSQGFQNTHKVNTSYKDFTQKQEQQFSQVKEMRTSAQLKKEYHQKKQDINDENKQRINFYTKDHVQQMFDGIPNDSKTSYAENLGKNNIQYEFKIKFTQDKQKVAHNIDLQYHNRKNDINVYTEAFVKHKKTMRK